MAAQIKRRLLWLLVPAVVAALYAANYMITPALVGETKLEALFRPKGEITFQLDKWKQTSPGGGARYRMIDDLLSKRLLLGKTQAEVKAILGEPSIAAPVDGDDAAYYLLGSQKDYPARSFLFPGRLPNLENWTLVIRFRDDRAYLVAVQVD